MPDFPAEGGPVSTFHLVLPKIEPSHHAAKAE